MMTEQLCTADQAKEKLDSLNGDIVLLEKQLDDIKYNQTQGN